MSTATAEVTYAVRPFGEEPGDMHSWTITEGGAEVSYLYADIATGMIGIVWTAESHRGQGLATRLYVEASRTVRLYHAPEWARTDDGSRFAANVGGPVIDTATAKEFYGWMADSIGAEIEYDCAGCGNCSQCCS